MPSCVLLHRDNAWRERLSSSSSSSFCNWGSRLEELPWLAPGHVACPRSHGCCVEDTRPPASGHTPPTLTYMAGSRLWPGEDRVLVHRPFPRGQMWPRCSFSFPSRNLTVEAAARRARGTRNYCGAAGTVAGEGLSLFPRASAFRGSDNGWK